MQGGNITLGDEIKKPRQNTMFYRGCADDDAQIYVDFRRMRVLDHWT